jgi:hypothetical protein
MKPFLIDTGQRAMPILVVPEGDGKRYVLYRNGAFRDPPYVAVFTLTSDEIIFLYHALPGEMPYEERSFDKP